MSRCGKVLCTCCSNAYAAGFRDGFGAGFRAGYDLGYVDGYVDRSLGREPVAPLASTVATRLREYQVETPLYQVPKVELPQLRPLAVDYASDWATRDRDDYYRRGGHLVMQQRRLMGY